MVLGFLVPMVQRKSAIAKKMFLRRSGFPANRQRSGDKMKLKLFFIVDNEDVLNDWLAEEKPDIKFITQSKDTRYERTVVCIWYEETLSKGGEIR